MTWQPDEPHGPRSQPTPEEPTRVLAGAADSPTLEEPARTRNRRPRRRRILRRIGVLVLVLLLVAAALLGDAVARQRTEQRVAEQIAGRVGAKAGTIGVDIGGWPFLAVLATDRVSSVDVTIPTATVRKDGRQATFRDISLHAAGVRNARDLDNAVVDQASASARLDWKELSRLSGATITSAGGTRVQVVRDVSILGATIAVKVSASPGLDTADRSVTLGEPQASLDGITIPSALLKPAMGSLSQKMVLPDLGSLRYQSLTADSRGVVISLTGTQVRLKDLQGG